MLDRAIVHEELQQRYEAEHLSSFNAKLSSSCFGLEMYDVTCPDGGNGRKDHVKMSGSWLNEGFS